MLVGMNTAAAGGGVRLLADGNQVPVLGLGVWQVPDGRECVNAVRWALEVGHPWYRSSCVAFSWLRSLRLAGFLFGRFPAGAAVEAWRACPAFA